MLSFVAQVCGPQQGVHQRVDQYVAVAVALQSPVVGNLHPAQDQAPAWCEGMRVETDTNANVGKMLQNTISLALTLD